MMDLLPAYGSYAFSTLSGGHDQIKMQNRTYVQINCFKYYVMKKNISYDMFPNRSQKSEHTNVLCHTYYQLIS